MNKKRHFFDSTIKLFEDYRRKTKREKIAGYNPYLSDEVHIRLRQLSFICKKIYSYEQIVLKPTSSIAEARRLTRFFDEGIVFVEAFYFIAWRIMCITSPGRGKPTPLPGLKSLRDKAEGVRVIRNDLIQHPEGKHKILMVSYSWGRDQGPALKNARPAGQTFEVKDQGLWVNAQEFKNAFEQLLQKAIAG